MLEFRNAEIVGTSNYNIGDEVEMNCKITRNAAKVLKLSWTSLKTKEKLRVVITHAHGDHAHYGLDLDTPKKTIP